MKRNIVLFPIKQQVAQVKLKKLSNRDLRTLYRYSIVLSPTAENVAGQNFDVTMQFSACSPFDKFNRKKGAEIAATKGKYLIKGITSKEQLEGVIEELVYIASINIDFEKVINDTAVKQADGTLVITTRGED